MSQQSNESRATSRNDGDDSDVSDLLAEGQKMRQIEDAAFVPSSCMNSPTISTQSSGALDSELLRDMNETLEKLCKEVNKLRKRVHKLDSTLNKALNIKKATKSVISKRDILTQMDFATNDDATERLQKNQTHRKSTVKHVENKNERCTKSKVIASSNQQTKEHHL